MNNERIRKHVQTIRCAKCRRRFIPEPRAAGRQRYCPNPECRKASQRSSHRRWGKNNPGIFSGTENTQRVQAWRKAHPDYYKTRKANTGAEELAAVLYDLAPQTVLQNVWLPQTVAIVGLIAWLRGARGKVLQKTIALDLREIMSRGHAICRKILPPRTL